MWDFVCVQQLTLTLTGVRAHQYFVHPGENTMKQFFPVLMEVTEGCRTWRWGENLNLWLTTLLNVFKFTIKNSLISVPGGWGWKKRICDLVTLPQSRGL